MHAAVISDDLTGAADTAAPFARAGYRTAVAFRGSPVQPAEDLDAVALDTDSRTLSADLAAKRVLEAAEAVREARIVYKKLDSTLRGALAAELAAALGGAGRALAVVAPAFPAAGRTTVRGVQLVRGVPVHETEARDDPRTPVVESHLPTLLGGAFSSVASLSVEDLADPETVRRTLAGAPCIVADAERDEHLEALVRAIPDPRRVLWAGSAGLALALARMYPGPRFGNGRGVPPSNAPARAVLVVVGSLSGVAREQLRSLREHGCAPIAVTIGGRSTSDGVAAARAALTNGSCAALHSAGERDSSSAGLVVAALAEVVAGLAGDQLFDALVLTGGETAVGVARRLGASGIALEGEVQPGMPVGALIGPKPYRVVTKAGAFGEPDTLRRVVEMLLESTEETGL